MFDEEKRTVQSILHVRIQQHSRKKHLTIIEGIPKEECTNIYGTLKKELACGGANKRHDGILQLMGDHSFKIKDILKKLLPEYDVILHGKKI